MELSSLVRKLGNGSPLPPGAAGSAAEGRRGLPDPSAGLRVCVGAARGLLHARLQRCGGFTRETGPSVACGSPAAGLGGSGVGLLPSSAVAESGGPCPTSASTRPPPHPEPLASFPPCVFPLFSPLPTWEGAVTHGGASLGNAEGFPLQKGCLSIR